MNDSNLHIVCDLQDRGFGALGWPLILNTNGGQEGVENYKQPLPVTAPIISRLGSDLRDLDFPFAVLNLGSNLFPSLHVMAL